MGPESVIRSTFDLLCMVQFCLNLDAMQELCCLGKMKKARSLRAGEKAVRVCFVLY